MTPAARIVVVRLDGIGDALACVPLLLALRDAGHAVGIVLSDRNAGVFAPGVFVARHVLERIPWPRHGSTPASRAAAEREIAAQRYDVALVASEEPEAYELVAPVRERVGFTTGWAKPLKSLWVRRQTTRTIHRAASAGRDATHEVDVLLRLARDLVPARAETDPLRLRTLLAVAATPPARAGIAVQLGAKWRTIGVADTTLARALAPLRARGARFLAAPGEAAAVAAAFPDFAIDVPATTAAWLAAIDGAAALVSPDTGAAHAAGMLGVPVVDAFPDAHFSVQTHRWRPWASAGVVVRASEIAKAPDTLLVTALDAL